MNRKEIETRKRKLISQRTTISKKLDKLEIEKQNLLRPEKEKAIGKCFKYKNNYSCPEKPSDYWWLYIRIIDLDEDGDYKTYRFQEDPNGTVEFETRQEYLDITGRDSFIPISIDEYATAKQSLLKKIELGQTKRTLSY